MDNDIECKKRRLKGEDYGDIQGDDLPANDAIELVFIENNLNEAYHSKPTYTHQAFEDEVITGLSNPEEAIVTVNVCCGDLTTYLGFDSSITPDEQLLLSSKLDVGLPPDYIQMGSRVFSEYSPYKLRRTTSGSLESRLSGVSRPPGSCVHSFTSHGNSFEIWRATYADKGAQKLLSRAEKLAVWFIETADGIDFSDDRWEALFLYKVTEARSVGTTDSESECHSRHSDRDALPSSEYYFVGYFTLFTFRNFIVGCKLRICQALIFPGYQGMGLGREMVLQVYRLARERSEVKEVAVEYPAPAFEALKDAADCDWAVIVHDEMVACASHEQGSEPFLSSKNPHKPTSDLQSLFNGDAGSCAHSLKLTSPQAYFVLDALKYCTLPSGKPPTSGLVDETKQLVEFRTEVKRRLQRENPEVKSLPKPKKFQRLEDLYQVQLQRFIAVRKHRAKHKL